MTSNQMRHLHVQIVLFAVFLSNHAEAVSDCRHFLLVPGMKVLEDRHIPNLKHTESQTTFTNLERVEDALKDLLRTLFLAAHAVKSQHDEALASEILENAMDAKKLAELALRPAFSSVREHFHLLPLRDLETEMDVSIAMHSQISYNPGFDRLKSRITFPLPIILSTNPLQTAIWARREWIRIAFEEIGHAAQFRLSNLGNENPTLSTLLNKDPILVQKIITDGKKLNSQRAHQNAAPIDWLNEADIYAFMIEQFGADFVPTWVGINSGYKLREDIDRAFGRPWKN
jgi:hypothetical protein